MGTASQGNADLVRGNGPTLSLEQGIDAFAAGAVFRIRCWTVDISRQTPESLRLRPYWHANCCRRAGLRQRPRSPEADVDHGNSTVSRV